MWPTGHSQTAILGNGAIHKSEQKDISSSTNERKHKKKLNRGRESGEEGGGGGEREEEKRKGSLFSTGSIMELPPSPLGPT